MKIKKQLSLLLMFCGVLFTYAQTQVSGTVVGLVQGENLFPEPRCSFKALPSVENGQNVEVSYVGYTTQVILFSGQDSLEVTLQEDLTELQEIVVTGYGSQKKANVTGAIAKIGGEDVASVQAVRVDDALAGKLAGVFIQNQDGSPGAAPKIQIRAAASISGASNPLIVVDGYPISGGLETVNPNDIQSIEILKDASSALHLIIVLMLVLQRSIVITSLNLVQNGLL